MADIIFSGLSILRDAWKYVRDVRENLQECQKVKTDALSFPLPFFPFPKTESPPSLSQDVKHVKGVLRYLDQTCRDLAAARLSDAEHERVHAMLASGITSPIY
jgi:hypothetical protein